MTTLSKRFLSSIPSTHYHTHPASLKCQPASPGQTLPRKRRGFLLPTSSFHIHLHSPCLQQQRGLILKQFLSISMALHEMHSSLLSLSATFSASRVRTSSATWASAPLSFLAVVVWRM